MPAAQIILALLQTSRIAIELVEKHRRGDMTDEELMAAWAEMQTRLRSASDEIRS